MHSVAPGIAVVPVRTPTLPPATHTNTYIVGEGALSVFDPASPWEDEQQRLDRALQHRIAGGERVERVVLTHHHADHVGGAVHLAARLEVPIVAHPANAALLAGQVQLDGFWEDGQVLNCGGRRLSATHTPGHAAGHLVFQDADSGAVIAGDMVAGVGTILIDPDEGDLGHYLASLEQMRRMDASVLLPAHGDPLPQAEAILSVYIAHRHSRTEQFRHLLFTAGASTPLEIAATIYANEIEPAFYPLAARQVLAHLIWMDRNGLAHPEADGRWVAHGTSERP